MWQTVTPFAVPEERLCLRQIDMQKPIQQPDIIHYRDSEAEIAAENIDSETESAGGDNDVVVEEAKDK